jgi:hypothetical protein
VIEAESGEKLIEKLWHPHDLFKVDDERLVVLSSGAFKIHNLNLATGATRLERELGGYVRGYYEAGGTALVGISAVRMFSRKQGADKRYFRGSFEEYCKESIFQSFVAKIDRKNDTVSYLPFLHMGAEIYEIYPVSPSVAPPLVRQPEIRKHMIVRWLLGEK